MQSSTTRLLPRVLTACAVCSLCLLPLGCTPPRPKNNGPVQTMHAGAATSVPVTETAAAADAPVLQAEVLSTDKWTFATAEGHIIRTANYRVYTTVENPVLRNRLATYLEHGLVHYRTALGPLPAPTQRLDTYLMKNRPQWEAVTKQLMGEQAEMLIKIPRGGYASRGIGVFYDIGIFDTLAISGHEGWHQYTQRVFKEQLPVWLEEGVATFMEGHRWEGNTPSFRPWSNVQRFDQLRTAADKNGLLPLEDLLDSRPQDFLDQSDDRVLTFYSQIWALVHFLNEGENGKYRASLRVLLGDAAAGRINESLRSRLGERAASSALVQRTGPGVFLAYFNEDLSAASSEYAAFLQQLVATGSRGPIVEGRSPINPLADNP